jgi:hypothetical protein
MAGISESRPWKCQRRRANIFRSGGVVFFWPPQLAASFISNVGTKRLNRDSCLHGRDEGKPDMTRTSPTRSRLTQRMVRPCVARGFVNLPDAVLHQCIRPLIGACFAPGHHGFQGACVLITGQASIGPFGSPVFACAGKTDPSIVVSSSRRPRRVRGVGYVIVAPHFALFLCSCLALVPSSRPACADAPRARTVKAGRRAVLTTCSTAARPDRHRPDLGV